MLFSNRNSNIRLLGLLLIPGLVLMYSKANAQYKEKTIQDSIKVSYKWRKDKILKKESPYVLMLQLENLSSTKVAVSFQVLFYWRSQLHSGSKIKEFCLKPGKKIRGKKWGLAFDSNTFTIKEYRDSMFWWYINELKVTKNDTYNHHLKLKILPAYSE